MGINIRFFGRKVIHIGLVDAEGYLTGTACGAKANVATAHASTYALSCKRCIAKAAKAE